jgi:hypothetical protein
LTAPLPVVAWAKVRVNEYGAPYNLDDPRGDFMTDINSAGHTLMRGNSSVTLNILEDTLNILEERLRPYVQDPNTMWWLISQGIAGAPTKSWIAFGEKTAAAQEEKGPDGRDGQGGEEYDGEVRDEYDGAGGEEYDEDYDE